MKGPRFAVFVSFVLVFQMIVIGFAGISQLSSEILAHEAPLDADTGPGPSPGLIDWRLPGPSTRANNSFSLVCQPDSQILSASHPTIYTNQTEWLVNHSAEWNIKYIMHEGDLTNNNAVNQWVNANNSQRLLDGKVPYALAIGNHDMAGNAATRSTRMNDYFNLTYYKSWPTLGGWFEDNKIENTYHLFSAGGFDWIILSLEMAPRDAVIAWANDVMASYPDRIGMLVTHNYMAGNSRNPGYGGNYGIITDPAGAASGEDIWQQHVKKHRNYLMVNSGHILVESGYLKSNGINKNPVHQMMANFQMNPYGGEGYMRLLQIDPDSGKIYVKTYSPYADAYKTSGNHQFVLNWNYWDYINFDPTVLNPVSQVDLVEDQLQEFVDLDGHTRPETGMFTDQDITAGDSLNYRLFDDVYGWGTTFDNGIFNASVLANGTLHIVPYADMFGSQVITINATDEIDGWITQDITVNIAPVNDRPVLNMTSEWWFHVPLPEEVISNRITTPEDQWCNFTLTAYDPVEPGDESGFSFYSNASAANASFFLLEESTGNVSFLPLNDDVGIYSLMVQVDDGGTVNNIDHFNFTIEITNMNDAPEITTENVAAAVQGQEYSNDYEAVDIDPTGDVLAWTLVTDAGFLTINGDTGELTGTPGNDDVGNHSVEVTVSDKKGGTDSTEFTLTVENVNDPPFLFSMPEDIIMQEDTVDTSLNLSSWFSDPDENLEGVTITGQQKIWVEFIEGETIKFAPAVNWSGTESITFTADDGEFSISDTLNVTVENVNDPPVNAVIGEYDVEYTTEDVIILHGEAEDGDIPYGDKLTFTWTSSVSGDIGRGENLTVKLTKGFHRITLTATDLKGESTKATTDLDIKEAEDPGPDDDILPDDDVEPDDDINKTDDDTADDDVQGGLAGATLAVLLGIIFLVIIGVIIVIVLLVLKGKRPEEQQKAEQGKEEARAAIEKTQAANEKTQAANEKTQAANGKAQAKEESGAPGSGLRQGEHIYNGLPYQEGPVLETGAVPAEMPVLDEELGEEYPDIEGSQPAIEDEQLIGTDGPEAGFDDHPEQLSNEEEEQGDANGSTGNTEK